jgi:hypothetical protein
MDKIKPYEETHQQGIVTFEQESRSMIVDDFGIQIAGDGRIWICINGASYIRFKPTSQSMYKLNRQMESEGCVE